MNLKKISIILSFICLLFIFLFIISSMRSCSRGEKNEQLSLTLATSSREIKKWKEKDGLNRAQIEILQGENTKMFLEIKTLDKEMLNLQSMVKKYEKQLKTGGSATIISTITQFDTLVIHTGMPPCDRVDSISNRWVNCRFGFKGDTSLFQLSITDSLSLVIGTEKKKPKRTFAIVTHYNPYTETRSFTSYQVTDNRKQKRLGIGPAIGAGFCMPPFKFGIFVGIVATYNLFYLY